MKIIKAPDTEWTKKHTCANCTAELLLEKKDIAFTHYDGDMREPGYDTWTTHCPICSITIHVKDDELPKAVQVEIKKRCDNGPYGGGSYYDR